MARFLIVLGTATLVLPYTAGALAALFAMGPLVLVLVLLVGGLIKLADLV